MAYIDSIPRPPRTLTEAEEKQLLKVTGEHRDGYRDHVIYAMALGTGLREHEIAALDVGDILAADGRHIRRRFPLRVFKRSNNDPAQQEVILPDALVYKLKRYLAWKRQEGEAFDRAAPLFVSLRRQRISLRALRERFATWQARAGFERRLTFHALRHTMLSKLYEREKDLRLVQVVARHANPRSTAIYTQPSDEKVMRAVRGLPC